MKTYYTAICFFSIELNKLPLKYRNINNLDKFEAFARQKGIRYINYYDKKTKQYSHRKWLY